MDNSVLGIVTAACSELGYDAPSTLAGNTDPDAAQFLALVQAVGEDLLQAADWSFLTTEGATITLASGQGAYVLPSDFDRLVGDTQWDRTNRWRTLGPDNPQEARWRRESVNSQIGPRRALRQVGNTVTCWPIPTSSGDVLAYDYVSNAFVVSGGGAVGNTAIAAGSLQSSFSFDTDTTLFRRRLMVRGVKFRWMAAKGFEATALEVDYESDKRSAIARDMGGGRVLSMASGRASDEHGNCDDVVASGPSVVLGTTGGLGIGPD